MIRSNRSLTIRAKALLVQREWSEESFYWNYMIYLCPSVICFHLTAVGSRFKQEGRKLVNILVTPSRDLVLIILQFLKIKSLLRTIKHLSCIVISWFLFKYKTELWKSIFCFNPRFQLEILPSILNTSSQHPSCINQNNNGGRFVCLKVWKPTFNLVFVRDQKKNWYFVSIAMNWVENWDASMYIGPKNCLTVKLNHLLTYSYRRCG